MVSIWAVVPWHTKRKDERRARALRADLEAMWAIASTMTGDDAAAFDPGDESAEASSDEPVPVEVVREVMRRTLPAWRRHRHRTSRLDIVITTTEAAALRVFSPSARPVRGGAHA